MNRRFLLVAVLLSVFLCGNAWAVEETDIQELQTDVSDAKSKADKNATETGSMRGGLPAEAAARKAADADLQNQIDVIELTTTPPMITHNAPSFTSDFELDITFTLSDDVELSHLIIQGDAAPTVQLTQYFEPGVADATITHTIGLNNGINKILVIAVDTAGNAEKILIEIEQGV